MLKNSDDRKLPCEVCGKAIDPKGLRMHLTGAACRNSARQVVTRRRNSRFVNKMNMKRRDIKANP